MNKSKNKKATANNGRRRSQGKTRATATEGSVGELLAWIMPALATDLTPPAWPADMFALCGAVLQKSGGYSVVVHHWPPDAPPGSLKQWAARIRRIGRAWRRGFKTGVPKEIEAWWRILLRHRDLPLGEVQSRIELCHALLQIVAAADEASAGAGIPSRRRDAFDDAAQFLLVPTTGDQKGATLCQAIDVSKIRVLPKQHIPSSGITMRSLTHHLAFCPSSDVVPYWHTAASIYVKKSSSLNILLVPWPLEVVPAQFAAAERPRGQMVKKFGFFTYSPRPGFAADRIQAIVDCAETDVGRIDGVILPELALTPEEHAELRNKLTSQGRFLICGICEPHGADDGPGRNYLVFDMPVRHGDKDGAHFTELRQGKHHRWRLDRSQIVQYGLGRQLDPSREWWEYIKLAQRELSFVTLKDWLTTCVLVCEDLARPDPVGDLVRAVGPNLVVALLMDGPQLAKRWPGRYATVLADDPGSSVLSLSSIGMVSLCRPPTGAAPSRAIALWKDAKNRDPIQIDLPAGADGVVLTLTRDLDEEYTPDGRSDFGHTAYPALSGIHVVKKAGEPEKAAELRSSPAPARR